MHTSLSENRWLVRTDVWSVRVYWSLSCLSEQSRMERLAPLPALALLEAAEDRWETGSRIRVVPRNLTPLT